MIGATSREKKRASGPHIEAISAHARFIYAAEEQALCAAEAPGHAVDCHVQAYKHKVNCGCERKCCLRDRRPSAPDRELRLACMGSQLIGNANSA